MGAPGNERGFSVPPFEFFPRLFFPGGGKRNPQSSPSLKKEGQEGFLVMP